MDSSNSGSPKKERQIRWGPIKKAYLNEIGMFQNEEDIEDEPERPERPVPMGEDDDPEDFLIPTREGFSKPNTNRIMDKIITRNAKLIHEKMNETQMSAARAKIAPQQGAMSGEGSSASTHTRSAPKKTRAPRKRKYDCVRDQSQTKKSNDK